MQELDRASFLRPEKLSPRRSATSPTMASPQAVSRRQRQQQQQQQHQASFASPAPKTHRVLDSPSTLPPTHRTYSSPATPTVRGLLSGLSVMSLISDTSAGSGQQQQQIQQLPSTPQRRKRKSKRRNLTSQQEQAVHHQQLQNEPFHWFRSVNAAIQSGKWNSLRNKLTASVQPKQPPNHGSGIPSQTHNHHYNNNNTPDSPRKKVGFWRRMVIGNHGTSGGDDSSSSHLDGSTGGAGGSEGLRLDHRNAFLKQDKDGRTILHAALTHAKTPTDILLLLLQMEPKAASIPNAKGRYPLHTAVWYGHHIEIIAELVEAHPTAIGATDGRGQTPLAYAMANAIQSTDLDKAPSSFWMPVTPRLESDDSSNSTSSSNMDVKTEEQGGGGNGVKRRSKGPTVEWQEAAIERWAVVHWLLLASATYPQTSLTVGGQKPMLVEALIFAAPPPVVSLLIGASVVLLSYETRASAFAGTTLYTCIARQYPLSILMSLALQCPADVRDVADETGMGLIAAQFVVGCFQRRNDATEEWALVEDVWMSIQETIMEGCLPDETIDPALCDWWAKIEFLIAFCSPNRQHAYAMSNSSTSKQRKYLLHQAAINPDVPPTVLRLLLALYPQSAMLPAPVDLGVKRASALPLTLVAQTPEYLPRNYELPIMTSENSLDIVMQAAPQAAWEQHQGRLPLHWAIAAGKSYRSLAALVDLDPKRMCRIRDPETKLYPFLLAAYVYGANGLGRLPREWRSQLVTQRENEDPSSSSSSGEEFDASARLYQQWTRMARNQYTHYVWKGLSERQKASAVYRVIQAKSVAGVSTIWQLMMHTPDLVPQTPFKRVPTNSARDERGVGTVANHFLTWCYPTKNPRSAHPIDPSTFHEEHWTTLCEAIRTAPSGGLAKLPVDFEKWYNKMRFWIRYCCPANPAVRRGNAKSLRVDPRWDFPSNEDDFLLHMAIMNPDTPPVAVNLLLGADPVAATRLIPNTRFLPLHIACRTPVYVPRFFEAPYDSSVKILTRVYPEATREFDDDYKLPLHRAIESRKPWLDLDVLVQAYPQSLLIRTKDTRLFPFQLMALPKPVTRIQRLNRLYKARNRVDSVHWDNYTPIEKVRAVRKEESSENLEVLNAIFELFRRNVSMVEPSSPLEMFAESAHTIMSEQQIDRHHKQGDEEVLENSFMTASESTINVPGLSAPDHITAYDMDPSETQDCLTENDTIISGMGMTNYSAHSDANTTNTFADHGRKRESKPSSSTGPTPEIGSESSDSLESYMPGGKEPSALMNFLSNHERVQSQHNEQSVFDCDTSVLSNVDVLSTLSSTLHSTIHSTLHNVPKRSLGRRYSSAGKGFDSEHGRVSEAGEESTDPDLNEQNHSSSSETTSSGSGSEFAGDSSAYLSFAIAGSSGHLSMDGDDIGDMSCTVNSEAVSFASAAARSVSENSDECSSSSLVHFKLRRKQRVEYWQDRDTLDPVRVTKQNLQLRTEDISSVYSATSSAKQSLEQQSTEKQQGQPHQGSESMSSVSSSDKRTTAELSPVARSVSLRSLKSTGLDSYTSLNSKDLMHGSVADMVWMPDELVRGKLLGHDSSKEFDENMLADLAFSKPATLSNSKSSFVSEIESGSSDSPSKSAHWDSAVSVGTNTENHDSFHEGSDGSHLVLIETRPEDYDSTEENEEVDKSELSETSRVSLDAISQTDRKSMMNQKSTDKLRRLMVPHEDKSEKDDSQYEESESSDKTEGSMGIDDVFVSNFSQRSRSSKLSGQSKRTEKSRSKTENPEEADEDVSITDIADKPIVISGTRDLAKPIKPDKETGITDKRNNVEFLLATSTDAPADPREPKVPSEPAFGALLTEHGSLLCTSCSDDPIVEARKNDQETLSVHLTSDQKLSSAELTEVSDIECVEALTSRHGSSRREETYLGSPTNKQEKREIVYFDRKEMRWKKKKADEVLQAPPLVQHLAPTVSDFNSVSPLLKVNEQPQHQKKKEMYFDRKSMRWRVREATGENQGRNLETNLSSIDENREASTQALVPPRRKSQTGSPFVELASPGVRKGSKPVAKAPPDKPEKKRITVNLGSIPERRSGGTPSLLDSKNMTCLLCNKNRREVLLKPCQHLSICRVCSREYKEIAMCPLCEGAVTDRMLIF